MRGPLTPRQRLDGRGCPHLDGVLYQKKELGEDRHPLPRARKKEVKRKDLYSHLASE